MNAKVKIGDTVRIISMEGEPQYTGKVGTVTSINPAYKPLGILEQLHGTWGGLAIQPDRDSYEILNHA